MKSPLSIGASSFAHDFKAIGGSPEALLVDKLFNKHSIPWSVIVIPLMHRKTVGGKVGMLYRFLVVKTDKNC